MIEFSHLAERVSSTELWWWIDVDLSIYRSLFDESAGNSLESLSTEDTLEFSKADFGTLQTQLIDRR